MLWLIISHPYLAMCKEKYRELLGNPKALYHNIFIVLYDGAKAETTVGWI